MKSFSTWHSGTRKRKGRRKEKERLVGSSLKPSCGEIVKEHLKNKRGHQNQLCLGSMYNSVCFIILSWVFAVLVFPGKTSSIPLFVLFVILCLHPSAFLSLALRLPFTHSGALLGLTLVLPSFLMLVCLLLQITSSVLFFWDMILTFVEKLSALDGSRHGFSQKESSKVPSHTCRLVTIWGDDTKP